MTNSHEKFPGGQRIESAEGARDETLKQAYDQLSQMENYARDFLAQKLGKGRDEITDDDMIKFHNCHFVESGLLSPKEQEPWLELIDQTLTSIRKTRQLNHEDQKDIDNDFPDGRGLGEAQNYIRQIRGFVTHGPFNLYQPLFVFSREKDRIREFFPELQLPETDTWGYKRREQNKNQKP